MIDLARALERCRFYLAGLVGLIWVLAAITPAGAAVPPPGPSPLLEKIHQRGELVVGVKTDMAPFGFLDAQGEPAGFEVDIARRLAEALGVRARLLSVSTENRFQRLEQGAVDMIIATAGDTRERRLLATAIEPNYYGGGVNVLLPPDSRAREWSDLRGQSLCALQGAYFNKAITQRHILTLQLYRNVRDALLAFREGRCAGFLYTDMALQHTLEEPEWAGYQLPLETTLVIPWAISLPRGEAGGAFARQVEDIIAGWHREGVLVDLERRWQLRPSPFLRDAHELWQRKDESGQFLCQRNSAGNWPAPCRNPAYVTAADTGGLQGLGLWIRETFGVNLSVVYDPYDRSRYLQGIGLTLLLSLCSMVGALLLGYLGAWVMLRPGRWAAGFMTLCVNYGRMTPPLLQMYFLFFGVGGYLWTTLGISFSPFLVAVWCLAHYHGGIITRILIEAARTLQAGDPTFRLGWAALPRLVEPAAVGIRTALNNLGKATTIASAIAVPELLSASLAVMADQGNPLVMMNLLLLLFFLISWFWMAVLLRLEQRVKRGVWRQPE